MHVLVPYDDSDPALDALEYAVDLFPDAEITVLHVVDERYLDSPYGQLLVGRDELRRRAVETAEAFLDDAEAAAADAGVDVETELRVGHPVRTILSYVDDHGIDHVVMGGTGLSNVPQVLLGSVSSGVVTHATVPVTVVR